MTISVAEHSKTAEINGSENFINQLRQVRENVSAVSRVKSLFVKKYHDAASLCKGELKSVRYSIFSNSSNFRLMMCRIELIFSAL